MKRIIIIIASTVMLISATGCSKSKEDFDKSREIGVISRESGSGTRGAFTELFGIKAADQNGEIFDLTTQNAVVTDKTAVMMTTVAGDLYSIGYISLGSLNDTVKPLAIDGAMPSIDSIKNGSYKISRPLGIATLPTLSAAGRDFINFIMSADGQRVIEKNDYIPVADNTAYSVTNATGKVTVSGSSSVTPIMEKLKEAYETVNENVTVEIQQSDTSTGIAATLDGTCDIGMVSRELKDSEAKNDIKSTVIALDGIVVIVNNDCPINRLSSIQIRDIFMGNTKTWSEII